ncbi:MAG: 4-alpha-glucanotransferase [Chitinophagaceae bacterium]|nr:4-alpha-glucanotransferase [Chitinophagaceae bacterium]
MGTEKKQSKKKISTKKVDEVLPPLKAELQTNSQTDEPVIVTTPDKKVTTADKKSAGKASEKKQSSTIPASNAGEIMQPIVEKKKLKKVKIKSFEPKEDVPQQSTLKRISFQLKYHTSVGENIFVTGSHPIVGNNNVEQAFALEYLNEEYWVGTIDLPEGESVDSFEYRYFVKDASGNTNMELGIDKFFDTSLFNAEEVRMLDTWSFSGQVENTFFTEPFQNVLLKQNFTATSSVEPTKYSHIFRVKAPLLAKNQVVALYGSAALLNKWDITKPVLLSRKEDEHWWSVKINLSNEAFPVTYKYGIYDIATRQFVQMEGDKNRIIYDGGASNKLSVVSDGFAIFPNNNFKGAGVAIPVFSLRSQQSFGVGEFNDMKLLVDWVKHVGLKVIQILPVNDTIATHSWVDSYPYAAISAFALHPLFLHLPSITNNENADLLGGLEPLKNELNSLDKVDYERVLVAKLQFAQTVFATQKNTIFQLADFQSFFLENRHWLVPYAAFSYLRDEYGTPDFSTWPKYNQYNEDEIKGIASSPEEAIDAIAFQFFVQYHLHLQLKAATEYAHQNGIIVKGDIPIGIYRNSSDAWQEPGLYNMNKQAGAPPDDFAIKGQNWGFPTYNWQRMQQDGFTWWKKRFAQMRYYFDAFRIDHILGFFRIWSIPMHAVEGILGNFVPALPVYKSELEERGIHLDLHRLTSPYINEGIVWEMFGDLAGKAKDEFLNITGYEHYALKPEFDTQRKVEKHFEHLQASDENHKLKYGLFNLISNIILLGAEDNEGQQFHFRIEMEGTASFRYLNGDTQSKLKDLYVNYFFRRQDHYWREQAMQKLPELKRSTNMLICGEDLGMVPDCVPGVMKQLGILSLEIQRMPKDPTKEFFHPNDAPYLSVVTPSTHDMSTIRGWWEEDAAKTQRFYNHQLGKWGNAPFYCEPQLNTAIIIQHLYSPAMWSIFQLQDLLGMDGSIRRVNPNDERINVPANPRHYWQYRMHLSLEDLLNHDGFNDVLRNYIVSSGR